MKLIKTKRQILIDNLKGKVCSWHTVNQCEKFLLKAMEEYGRQCKREIVDRIKLKGK